MLLSFRFTIIQGLRPCTEEKKEGRGIPGREKKGGERLAVHLQASFFRYKKPAEKGGKSDLAGEKKGRREGRTPAHLPSAASRGERGAEKLDPTSSLRRHALTKGREKKKKKKKNAGHRGRTSRKSNEVPPPVRRGGREEGSPGGRGGGGKEEGDSVSA